MQYQNKKLHIENVSLDTIANQFGTPCYVYSRKILEDNWRAFDDALGQYPHRICYAVKANSNLAILNLFARLQSGFDIVSQGELERVLKAHGDPQKIVFSGVGKSAAEMLRALEVGVSCFDVESEVELQRLNEIAKQQKKIANVALRVNPNIDARTHPYISTGLHENKFGIEYTRIFSLAQEMVTMSNVKLVGLACHIGSQLTELDPFLEAIDCLLELIEQLSSDNIILKHINIGGGLGVRYHDENPPKITEYVSALRKKLEKYQLEIILEPGRSIVANAGILLTRVEYLKQTSHKNFAIVDAAMNDLMRPALYEAWHDIIPVLPHDEDERIYDIVGPVCESADVLGRERTLCLKPNDLLAILGAGAYGFSMSSNYNSRPRIPEVLVDGDQVHLIREREKMSDLFALEKMLSS